MILKFDIKTKDLVNTFITIEDAYKDVNVKSITKTKFLAHIKGEKIINNGTLSHVISIGGYQYIQLHEDVKIKDAINLYKYYSDLKDSSFNTIVYKLHNSMKNE